MSEVSASSVHVGPYEILAPLGQGGMARVSLASARDENGAPHLVVIKQIRPELAAQEEMRRMFEDEARLALRLDHPNVVRTYEILEEGGEVAMVLEYLEGQTLAETLNRIGRTQFPVEESLWILTQVLAGLHHGHELRGDDGALLGVVHQDVSPSNVFVTYDGEVKVLDFGIASGGRGKGPSRGKLGYAAPEQFLARKPDPRSDVHAVGVMLWEAIAGRRRSGGSDTPTSTREARVGGLETNIREVRPDVPAELAEVIDRATAVDPRNRFRSAADMQRELERILARSPRKVGQRELAALMWVHFRADRLQRRTRIEERLSGLAPAGPEEGAPAPPPAMLPTVRLQAPRATFAAGVIAAAGVIGVVVGLVRGPSRTEPPAPPGAPPAHSVVLERVEPLPSHPLPPAPSPPVHAAARPAALAGEHAVKPAGRNADAADHPAERATARAEQPRATTRADQPRGDDERALRPRPHPPVRAGNHLVDRGVDHNLAVIHQEIEPGPLPERRRSVEPGMQLVRPERPPAQRPLDEKDPYSP